MSDLKQILFLLLSPLVAGGQTIHSEQDKIVYKGTVHVSNVDQAELYQRAAIALKYINSSSDIKGKDHNDKSKIVAAGQLKLTTAYYIVRTVFYNFELTVEDGKFKYRIDSVYMKERQRGGKTATLSSDKMLKAMEETGPPSIVAEKELNEIDMNFQKIIALVSSAMKKPSVAQNDKAADRPD
jgi:Domain of unknown function (DUF4468) with TBP-like fold